MNADKFEVKRVAKLTATLSQRLSC